jgi:hypothetical protein
MPTPSGSVITLQKGSATPITRLFGVGPILEIAGGSGSGTLANFTLVGETACLAVGDRVIVVHSAACGDISQCGTVQLIASDVVTVGLTTAPTTATATWTGDANGFIIKAADMTGRILIGGIYTHLGQSPAGMTGAIDQGGSTILVKGATPGDIVPGDMVTLAAAGITNSKVTSVRTGSLGSAAVLVVQVAGTATVAIPTTAMKPLSRKGSILAQFAFEPAAPLCGIISGAIPASVAASLSLDSPNCAPCDETGLVGCYQLFLARGSVPPADLVALGYKPFYYQAVDLIDQGQVYLRGTVL